MANAPVDRRDPHENRGEAYWMRATERLRAFLATERDQKALRKWASAMDQSVAWLDNALAWLEMHHHVVRNQVGGKTRWLAAPQVLERINRPNTFATAPRPKPPLPATLEDAIIDPPKEEAPVATTCKGCGQPGTMAKRVNSATGFHAACEPKRAPDDVQVDREALTLARRLKYCATSLEQGLLQVPDVTALLENILKGLRDPRGPRG